MKTRLLAAGIGLMACSTAFAQLTDANGPPPPPPPALPSPLPPPPPAASAPKAVAARQEEPEPKIEGVALTRPNGTYLGLQVVNNNFVLTFYDAKKKKMAPDVARATVRWDVKYQPGPERTVLNPGGGPASLTSEKTVRPPLNFRVFLSLFVEGSEDAVESYSVDYHG